MSDIKEKTRIILHIDMDYFFAQCEEREHPELKGKPVVICVYSGRGGDRGAVSTSNYEARKLGVKAGISISRAKKLAPNAVFLPVNMELYHYKSGQVMEILKEYSDKIEQESIDEAYCDLTEKVTGFEGARMLALKLKDEIRQLVGLTCSVGIGPNKLIAKVASDYKKPDGLTVVRSEEVLQFLAPLKTHTKSLTLGVPARDVETIRAKAHELAKSFLLENPIPLRRVGIRVSNLVEQIGQKTLGDY